MNDITHKTQYMHNLLQHIENNMSDDIDTALLSSVGYVSRRKLYYDFYSISGHSVKEYVRKRRLSNALALIKTSTSSFTDIAFQCGYSSYQALCRAVQQTLGMTISEYKRSSTYYFFPPFGGEPLQSVTVANETIPASLRVLFFHSRLSDIENVALSTFLRAFPNYDGRVFGRNGKQAGKKFCYELYLTKTEQNYDILKLHGFEIAGGFPCVTAMFASSTTPNDERQINATWNYLYSDWLQNSMFEYTNEPYFEEYIIKNNRPVKLKLYLPIRERSEETKITLAKNLDLRFITAKAKGYNAEKIASQTLINYLTSNYPNIVNNLNELYLQKEQNCCVCGVKVNPHLRFIDDENISSITTVPGYYLVLESNIMGDYYRYADMLFSFARDNGMNADKKHIFAVYDTTDSFTNPQIKMYCPIKICTK